MCLAQVPCVSQEEVSIRLSAPSKRACVCVCVYLLEKVRLRFECVFPEGRLSRGDQGERWRLTDQTPEPPQKDLRDSALLAQVPII